MTPWTAAHQASLLYTVSQSLFKLVFIELVMPSNHLIHCHPLLLLPSIFPSIRGFSNELALCIRWPKYWSFSVSISPSSEYSRLISFATDWLDLLAVQGTLKNLLQHQKHQFFGARPFYGPKLTSIQNYCKNHSFTRQTFASKVMSLFFNTLSRFLIPFLPRSKCLLISWL